MPKFTTKAKSYKFSAIPLLSNVTAKIQGLVSTLLVKVKPGDQQQAILDVPLCTVKIDKIDPLPLVAPGMKEKAIAAIKAVILRQIPQAFCKAAKLVSAKVNQGFFHFGHKIGKPPLADALIKEKFHHSKEKSGKKFDLHVLCGYDPLSKDETSTGRIGGYLNRFLANATKELGGDMEFVTKLKQEPKFTQDQMVMGVEAGFVSKKIGRLLSESKLPKKLNFSRTDKDLCLGVGESAVNSFFEQAQQKGFFRSHHNVSQDQLQTPVLNLIKKLFAKRPDFHVILDVKSEESPKMRFLPTGSRVSAKTRLQFGAKSGNNTEKLVEALVDMDVLTKLFIKNHFVQGIL